jgi:hypothetical protein
MAQATIEICDDGKNIKIRVSLIGRASDGSLSRAQSLALGLAEGAQRSGLAVEIDSSGNVLLGHVSVN